MTVFQFPKHDMGDKWLREVWADVRTKTIERLKSQGVSQPRASEILDCARPYWMEVGRLYTTPFEFNLDVTWKLSPEQNEMVMSEVNRFNAAWRTHIIQAVADAQSAVIQETINGMVD